MQHAWDERNNYKIVVGKLEGKRFRRARCRWRILLKRVLNRLLIRIDWLRIGALVNTVMNLRFP